jgi:hypothetical protein
MGLGSRARAVAGEFHLKGGEYGLWTGGRADLDRHLDEVEPAGQALGPAACAPTAPTPHRCVAGSIATNIHSSWARYDDP